MEKEYIDTNFDSFTKEETTFKHICMEVIYIEKGKINEKNTEEQMTWKLEKYMENINMYNQR